LKLFALKNKGYPSSYVSQVSKDGLAVRYSSNGQQSSVSSELDVFIMDSNFYIEKIQIKIVSDFEVGGKSLLSSQTNRQRCFQFGRMKSSQHFQLDYLLQNYTKEDMNWGRGVNGIKS